MKMTPIPKNQKFVDRLKEQKVLRHIAAQKEASILILYGRRRIGKTELLEQTYRLRNLIKIEGIADKSPAKQRQIALRQFNQYANNPLLDKITLSSWSEFFEIVHPYIKKGEWTLYFEEVQWLANYQADFISELKYAWDNFFRYNNQLLLILCGSSPSFMINHVLHSKALYNRSQYECLLKGFTLSETQEMLKKRSLREVMDAYLTVGGVPEYLKRINQESSLFLGICNNAFRSQGYFTHEKDRIFISSMANNKHYEKVIDLLSRHKFLTRPQIAQYLKLKAGGVLTDLLTDLTESGFIEKYVPYNLKTHSKLARYCIADPYLQFYYKFIKNKLSRIIDGEYNDHPMRAINMSSYQKWLGFSFERYCRHQHAHIANLLGFSAVQYQAGAFYNRTTQHEDPGYQIDLLFDRDDKVYTICEIKYTQAPVGTKVIKEMEEKLSYFPNPRHKTIQKVLISAAGTQPSLIGRAYFDQILTLDDFIQQ